MTQKTLKIKNMVCPRCIESVQNILESMGIPSDQVLLGVVNLKAPLAGNQKNFLNEKLKEKGFAIIDNTQEQIVSQAKAAIIAHIHHNTTEEPQGISNVLQDKLNMAYDKLSRIFSAIEGCTIEKYTMRQKIERVKALIFYQELTLSEIAYQMGYSSVSHLSKQFKKEVGMTPTDFKKQGKPGHQPLNEL